MNKQEEDQLSLTLKVRNLHRHPSDPAAYWLAEVSAGDGKWTPVHRRWGSWIKGWGTGATEVRRVVAAELQRRVLKLERTERSDQKKEQDA